jgi:hypothetical protein
MPRIAFSIMITKGLNLFNFLSIVAAFVIKMRFVEMTIHDKGTNDGATI